MKAIDQQRIARRLDYIERQLLNCGSEIVYLQTDQHRIKAYLPDGSYRILIGNLSEILDARPGQYVRVARGIAVNPKHVVHATLKAYSPAELQIVLRNQVRIKCHTNYILEFAAQKLITYP